MITETKKSKYEGREMKILFYDSKEYDRTSFGEANKNNYEIHFRTKRLTLDTVRYAEGSDAICTFVNCDASAEVIEGLAKVGVKFIFQRSAGYNNIDLKKAGELGIKVYRVPAYSPEAVAEHAATLMLSINRNIHIAYQRTSMKNFALNGLQGETIFGATIGVMGAGRIGCSFIKIAKGLGAKVIVFDEFAQKNFPQTAEDLGFKYVDKETLFKEADFISLHLPLMPATKHIVNKDVLRLAKPNLILINTSRGGLVNTGDLLDFLDYGKIRGAGLDVYENEEGIFFYDKSNDLIPDPLLNRLRAHRNVIITSHQAFFTNLALRQIADTTMNNAALAEKGEDGNTRLILQSDGKVLNG